jgi:hypothetical protein
MLNLSSVGGLPSMSGKNGTQLQRLIYPNRKKDAMSGRFFLVALRDFAY